MLIYFQWWRISPKSCWSCIRHMFNTWCLLATNQVSFLTNPLAFSYFVIIVLFVWFNHFCFFFFFLLLLYGLLVLVLLLKRFEFEIWLHSKGRGSCGSIFEDFHDLWKLGKGCTSQCGKIFVVSMRGSPVSTCHFYLTPFTIARYWMGGRHWRGGIVGRQQDSGLKSVHILALIHYQTWLYDPVSCYRNSVERTSEIVYIYMISHPVVWHCIW